MDIPRNSDITYFGRTHFRDIDKPFGIKRRDRRQHVYVLGKSGTGKSALLKNMIVQNIANGEGVAVVDPHGELVEEILSLIPTERQDDVVYFNPSDTDYHIGFNVLEATEEKYKHLIASGLMSVFTKIWANVWSARMEYILNNAISALIDTPDSTMLGIPRLLVDKEYRKVVINNIKDPVVKSFWVNEYETWQDKFRNEAIAPIQNKVGQFLSSAVIRNVVGQAKSTINIFNIMNEKKVFLVNVSKGRIGEDNSALLGAMMITKIQLSAMERVRIPEEERKDFYLYVDEFQNFVTDSFANILSEARKYRLCLTLAHQYIGQLVSGDSATVRDAIFGNVGSMIIFRVGAADAEFLEKEFEPEVTPEDFVGLPNYTIYTKLMIDGITSRPFSANTLPPFKIEGSQKIAESIMQRSRELYARPRPIIEAEINYWSKSRPGDPPFDPHTTEAEIPASSDKSTNEPLATADGKYRIPCSLYAECGNIAEVPFKPEKGRPVYCKEHIEKIKNGEVKPVTFKPRINREAQDSMNILSSLGIGNFESTSQNYSRNKALQKPTEKNYSHNNNQTTRKPLHKQFAQNISSEVPTIKDIPRIKDTSETKITSVLKKEGSLSKFSQHQPSTSLRKLTPKTNSEKSRSAKPESLASLKSLLKKIAHDTPPQTKSTTESLPSAQNNHQSNPQDADTELFLDNQPQESSRQSTQNNENQASVHREIPEDILRKVLE